jgi:DNA ligase-1
MNRLSQVAEAIAGTSKKNEKVRLLAEYMRSRTVEEPAVSAVFLSGRPFSAWEEVTLQVGGALLVRVILDVSGRRNTELDRAYRETGDLGAAAAMLFQQRSPEQRRPGAGYGLLNVVAVGEAFRAIAVARGPAPKAALLRQLLEGATPLEAKYLVKIMTGELRIGLKESLVEQAIATAYLAPPAEVERAGMLLGDIGETLHLAAAQRVHTARMRMFHPLGFMLASPIDSPADSITYFAHAQVEDKYDGIRAQAHCSPAQVRIFSRTRDDITESFPELIEPLTALDGVILDGEIVAWDFRRGQALPFAELQKRLGRKRVTATMMRAVPVAYVVFDTLYAEGELVIDRPLRDRNEVLNRIFAQATPPRRSVRGARAPVRDLQRALAFEPAIMEEPAAPDEAPRLIVRAPALHADSPEELEQLFERAQARRNEGLMIKDPDSTYTPGRRGHSWLKMKRELATLDVAVTSVEWGHGRRIGVLSNYTFAVRAREAVGRANEWPHTSSGEPLLNVGKAYSGLTDREISDMTEWFLAHTVADHGFWREVEPTVVVEVAFNAVMRSDRHSSGYALRFPRILRLRRDKPVEEVDTLDRVREIYERQQLPKTA